jgi:2-polyprenyl-3-methyl-5-hydroxy-6-metoxy-1,4-benzoquinol methylase
VAKDTSEYSLNPYSYDEVPYTSKPFVQTHPDRMAVIGTLFGMTPQPIDACRVLEIGCAGGGNLVPMAEQLPRSSFVGIDLSRVQIDEARRSAQDAGLTNIDLKQCDILDVNGGFGRFDYIICHGIYSWVPNDVQDKILDICAARLAPQGVAYVSYNIYPVWHMCGMIRDMMSYHTSRFRESRTRIEQARLLLDFLAKNASEQNAYGMLLKSELEVLRQHEDAYLFHEHLEEVNDPIYFHQFVQRAVAKKLQYLGEAEMTSMWAGHLPPEVAGTLERVASDFVQMEQYTDFVRNRMFRQTLLCHRDLEVDRELKPGSLAPLHVASPFIPAHPGADIRSAGPLKFQHLGHDLHLTASGPLMKAAMLCLAEAWPGSVPFPKLVSTACSRVEGGSVHGTQGLAESTDELGRSLLECYVSDMVELHSAPPCFFAQVGPRPAASRVARAQVQSGEKLVTNLRHDYGR